jgi:lipopolysaccharide export system protein LptC
MFSVPRYLRTASLIGLVVVLALAVGYFNIRPSTFDQTPLVLDPLQPDFFMENTQILMFNEQGTLAYQLRSDRATHQRADDSTLLEQPNLLYYRPGEAHPWLLQAQQGVVTSGGKQVDMMNDVLLQRQDPAAPTARLTTQALTLYPERDYAETAQSVRIQTAGSNTTATGMQVFLNDGRLELLSNVRGQHELH